MVAPDAAVTTAGVTPGLELTNASDAIASDATMRNSTPSLLRAVGQRSERILRFMGPYLLLILSAAAGIARRTCTCRRCAHGGGAVGAGGWCLSCARIVSPW